MANSSTLQVIIKEDPGIKETAKRYERASKNNQIQGPQKRKAEGYYDTIRRYQDRTVDSLSTKELNDFKSAFKSLVDIVEKATNIKQSKYSQDLKRREQLEVQKQKVLGNIQHTGFTQKVIKDPSFQPGVTQMGSLSLKEVYNRMFKDGGAYGMQKLPQNDLKTLLDDKNGFSRFKSAIEGKSTLISKESMAAVQEVFEKFKTGGEHFNTIWRQGTKEAVKYLNILEEIAKVDKEIKANEKHLSNDDKFANVTKDTNKRINEAIEAQLKKQEVEKEAAQANKETADAVEKTNGALKRQESAVSKAVKKFAIYGIAIKTLKAALSEAVRTVKELDKSLTEQAMVTGLTREQTYGLIGSYQKLALETGATTKEIAEVSTEYMKQGKTIAETQKLTKAAVSAAKVARVSVGDSVNYLTTALNGFRLSADQAMLVSDKFAAVAAASATDYDELAIALSKVASQANLAGMSIDYTTALLTKGLETTREAPETMGTALKTIIARMRELTDYGKTLEDGVSLNNVESQLEYVGIKLRDQNGELRSTQEVLDELGKKWSTLNKNQQAALAKALAGTRQQSRLIALMDNYERVTELQEIAQRSAGATAAQAEVYLEGLEASLNKIKVAWESIVQSVAKSDVVMGVVNLAAKLMQGIAKSMESVAAQRAVLGGIVALSVTLGLKKVAEWGTQQAITREYEKQEAILRRINELEKDKKSTEALQIFKDKGIIGDDHADISELKRAIKGKSKKITLSEDQAKVGKELLKSRKPGFWKTATADFKGATGGWGKAASLGKSAGKALGAVGGALAVGATVFSVASAIQGMIDFRTQTEKAVDEMKKLGNESYRASQKAYEIGNAARKIEELDKKLIKTKEDHAEMNSLLEGAAEKLSEEEKKEFDNMTSVQEKNAYLKKVEQESKKTARAKQDQIVQNFLKADNRSELKNNAEYRDALFSATKGKLYDSLDSLNLKGKDRTNANEIVTMLADNLDIDQVEKLLSDKNAIDSVVSQLAGNQEALSILNSDDANFTDKIKAFQELKTVLGENSAAAQALNSAFNDLNDLSLKFKDGKVLDWMDSIGMTTEDLNNLNDSFNAFAHEDIGLKVSQEEYTNLLTEKFLPALSQGVSVQEAFNDTFGGVIENQDKGLNLMLDKMQGIVGKNILEAGQTMDSFKNSVSGFYETASKWNEMSETDKTSFISSHQDMFKGEQGAELLKALESGNYKMIEAALGSNEQLEKKRQENLDWVEETLELEKQKTEDARDEAYISQLESYKKYLNDKENMFKVSLKTELDQQNKQIDMYKNYLAQQQKTQVDSLNKRKDAYQKYWADLDKIESAENYDEKRKTLEDNLAKMGTASGFDAESRKKELETELNNLQKERSKELRQQARDSIMDNIDDQLEKVNTSFDKVLNNQQALLELLGKELTNPDAFFGKMAKQAQMQGMTGLQLAEWQGRLKNTFSSALQHYDWSNTMTNSNNTYTLNFGGNVYGAKGLDTSFLNNYLKIGGRI